MKKTLELRSKVSQVAAIMGVVLVGVAASGARAQDKDARMVTQTLSEEKTEIQQLAAQQAMLKKMGGPENRRIASMFGRWIVEHKAAGPTLMNLIRKHGGNPTDVKILKAPVLGDKTKMLHATMVDHMKAVESSRARAAMTNDAAVKKAMRARIALASKHMRQMKPYHNEKNCPMCAQMMKGGMKGGMQHGMMHGMKSGGTMNGKKTAAVMCPHCHVAMVNGKCPECGMTMEQMKQERSKG
jgi:hypothetical protein